MREGMERPGQMRKKQKGMGRKRKVEDCTGRLLPGAQLPSKSHVKVYGRSSVNDYRQSGDHRHDCRGAGGIAGNRAEGCAAVQPDAGMGDFGGLLSAIDT